ncbi:MAG TPA: N-acetylmuramoyl-L-alanine amidase [Gemmatimonadales bacterium]|nr:N-acetylmuramoyl-L-alanine amidase [Gemmatimonadales bacterium]
MGRKAPYTLVGSILLLVGAAACRQTPVQPCSTPAGAAQGLSRIPLGASPFDSAFRAAGAEFAVPPAVLAGVGWAETRWQMIQGGEELPGLAPAFGVMALRGGALERGAALARVSVEAARRDPVANIRAAAALLDAYAREASIDRTRLAEWGPVIWRYSGLERSDARSAYAREVDRTFDRPALAPLIGTGPCPPTGGGGGAPDYAPAVWRPSPNFDQRAGDSTGVIHMLIIHTCESNYVSCWSWLVNPAAQASAHYVVNEDGTEISQLVREANRAWHIAALYDCTLNRRHECWRNGVQSNHFTVGIEHAGFASQSSFPPSQLEASAALACNITRTHAIPRDWQHIVGHGQLQPADRTDPGPNWPWISYLHRVQAICGEVVIDDSAQFNDTLVAVATVPAGWAASDTTPDFYGGGYRWASTQPAATDAAVFSFRLTAAEPRTIDVRWTSGANRSPVATYAVVTSAGDTVAVVSQDQRSGGGTWHTLGTWTFPAGWNRVALERRGAVGPVVVADAVRARR